MPNHSGARFEGVLYGAGAYAIWGFSVLYWKLLTEIGPLEAISHRVIWASILLAGMLMWRGRLGQAWTLIKVRRNFLILCLTSALLALNWSIFVWSVMTDRILQASLGYYINPLVSIVIGYFLLHEKMNRLQLSAIALATLGVLGMVMINGSLPWPALTLAVTFGIYGYIRKVVNFVALEALFIEMTLCVPFVLVIIFWIERGGQGVIGAGDFGMIGLLVGAGLMTLTPLLLFGEAVTRVRLITMGLLQYIAPTTQFLLAVLIYGEAFTSGHIFAFICIWMALALYSGDTLWRERARSGAL